MNTNDNCRHCPDYSKKCSGKDNSCICYRCPRDLATCIMTKYCRETESVLIMEDWED